MGTAPMLSRSTGYGLYRWNNFPDRDNQKERSAAIMKSATVITEQVQYYCTQGNKGQSNN